MNLSDYELDTGVISDIRVQRTLTFMERECGHTVSYSRQCRVSVPAMLLSPPTEHLQS